MIQAAKVDGLEAVSVLKRQGRWFRSCKCFEEIKEREKVRRLGGESSTYMVSI